MRARFSASILLTFELGGQITESGTYRQLAADKNTRFHKLMAAQLEAAVTSSSTDQDHQQDEPSK